MNTISLVEAARECAALMRLGREVEGGVRMVELFESALPGLEPHAGAMLFQAMLDAQQRQDWLALADYLEYELVHLIEQGAAC